MQPAAHCSGPWYMDIFFNWTLGLNQLKKKKSKVPGDGDVINQQYCISVILLELELTTIALMFRA